AGGSRIAQTRRIAWRPRRSVRASYRRRQCARDAARGAADRAASRVEEKGQCPSNVTSCGRDDVLFGGQCAPCVGYKNSGKKCTLSFGTLLSGAAPALLQGAGTDVLPARPQLLCFGPAGADALGLQLLRPLVDLVAVALDPCFTPFVSPYLSPPPLCDLRAPLGRELLCCLLQKPPGRLIAALHETFSECEAPRVICVQLQRTLND